VITEVDTYAEIRKRFNEGESMRSIFRALGMSRQTVKKDFHSLFIRLNWESDHA
jgi:hypothetical protein